MVILYFLSKTALLMKKSVVLRPSVEHVFFFIRFSLVTCNSKCKYSKMCSSSKCCDGTDPSYCGYYVQYADKSEYIFHIVFIHRTEGGLSRDIIALVGSSQDTQAIKTTFGLTLYINPFCFILSKESGTWVSFADGLMGSSYGNGNGNPSISPSWFDSYVESDSSISDIFVTCFGREKGVLSVGGLDSSLKVFVILCFFHFRKVPSTMLISKILSSLVFV